jgi:hypothetical protein
MSFFVYPLNAKIVFPRCFISMDTRKPITDPQPEQPAEQNAAEGNTRHLFDRIFKRAMRQINAPAGR